MRVLQVHNRQSQSGGADRVLDDERLQLENAGCRTARFTVDTETELSRGVFRAAGRSIWNMDASERLSDAIARFGPDIVHVHTPFPVMSPAPLRSVGASGAALVGTMHSFRYMCVSGTLLRDGRPCTRCVGKSVKAPAVRFGCYHDSRTKTLPLATSLTLHRAIGTFGRIHKLVTLSEFSRRLAIDEGFRPDQVDVKPNSVVDPGPQPTRRNGRVVFVGRLVEEKGIRTLLEAWRDTELPPLDVYGDGPLRGLVEQAVEAGLAVSFHGPVDQHTVTEALGRSSLLVFPSEWFEAGPTLVMLESFAAATPVIASDVGNFSDAIQKGVNGSTFVTGDARDLAAKVVEAMHPPVQHTMMAGARQTYLRDHTPERSAQRLIEIYERASAEVAARS